ncbi:MAG: molybdenum cofactor biosynthesis protein MoaE [Planctomycetota bacterium]
MATNENEPGVPAPGASRSVTVRLFAALRERAGADAVDVADVPAGSTLGELKALAVAQHPALGSLDAVAGVVGTTYATDDHVLEDGDQIALLPPVSGGEPTEDELLEDGVFELSADPIDAVAGVVGTTYATDDHVLEDGDQIALLPPVSGGEPTEDELLEDGVFELSADPIDVAALQARVGHPSCGAIVVFTGATRDTNRGEDVVRLDYEAFHEMSGPQMRRIFARCLDQHGPGAVADGVDRRLRMVCVHRTGTVGVGEPSVVIAVASPHRAAAFDAARFLIDTLKEELPVWKKEIYLGGHHWIGDRS